MRILLSLIKNMCESNNKVETGRKRKDFLSHLTAETVCCKTARSRKGAKSKHAERKRF